MLLTCKKAGPYHASWSIQGLPGTTLIEESNGWFISRNLPISKAYWKYRESNKIPKFILNENVFYFSSDPYWDFTSKEKIVRHLMPQNVISNFNPGEQWNDFVKITFEALSNMRYSEFLKIQKQCKVETKRSYFMGYSEKVTESFLLNALPKCNAENPYRTPRFIEDCFYDLFAQYSNNVHSLLKHEKILMDLKVNELLAYEKIENINKPIFRCYDESQNTGNNKEELPF